MKKASNEAFFVLEKKTVPKTVSSNKTYRKRFLKEKTVHKLPSIVRAKNDWFVKYSYEWPDHPGNFKDFRVRDGINYIHDIELREKEINKLRDDIEYALKTLGFNPFKVKVDSENQIPKATMAIITRK